MRDISQRIGSEAEAMRVMMDKVGCDIRVSAPGIIQSFDPKKQTARVKVAIRELVTIEGKTRDEEIPELPDVPVHFPRGAGWSLTFPVKAGDECLVVFGDMCIDAWWDAGGIQSQTERRRHDLSDAFAIVGVSSVPKAIKDFRTDAIVMQREEGGPYFAAGEDDAEVYARGNVTVKADGDITATAKGNAVVAAGGTATLSAGRVLIEGELIINGKPYLDHRHTETGITTEGVIE